MCVCVPVNSKTLDRIKTFNCNIDGFIATYISKLKWAWQA